MNDRVIIDEFDIGIFEEQAELFGSYYGTSDKLMAINYADWLYAKNPFGRARVVRTIESGRLIGSMAMVPVRLARKNSQLNAYYVVNVLVHPAHQGKRVFGRMIEAATDLIATENAALMGHPNKAAMKPWQRAGMHFHDPLKPNLIAPRVFGRKVHARDIQESQKLGSILIALKEQMERSTLWGPDLSSEYIEWRYFLHPVNSYWIRLIEVEGVPVGFMIVRKMFHGANLFIDQFLLEQFLPECLGLVPRFTVAFTTDAFRSEVPRRLWRLPIKKQLPFFCTHFNQPFSSYDVRRFGLSMSDF